MTDKKRIMLLTLAGLLLICTALVNERESKTLSEIQQAEGELDYIGLNGVRARIILARTPDSMRDSSHAAIADSLRRGDAAAAELSSLIIPALREQLLRERLAFWVSLICGFLFLMLYLRQVLLDQGSTDENARDVEH